MPVSRLRPLLLISSAALLGSPVGASQIAPVPIPPPLVISIPFADGLYSGITSGMGIERYLADLVQPIRSYGSTPGILTRADIELERRKEQAAARASALSEVMRYDLDGDGVVTRAEIRQAVVRDGNGRPDRTVDELIDRYDANGDDRITQAEISTAADDSPRLYQVARLDALLTLDPSGDGRLTIDELTTIGREVFGRFDTDHDGQISPAEYTAGQPLLRKMMEAGQRQSAELFGPRCAMPAVPPKARIVAVGTYGAPALSPFAVGGQDKATDLTVIHIEKGTEPLYLVLASYESMMWALDGDVRRVVQVVASSFEKAPGGVSAVAVTAIKADRLTALRGDCLSYFYKPDSLEAMRARGVIRRSLGRVPDAMVGTYSARAVSIPSGAIEQVARGATAPAPPGFDTRAWEDAARFWPAGIAKLDRRTVVSKTTVAPYEVFPSQAGIAQLIASGAIVHDGTGRDLKIVRPIPRYPARMTGSHSERLIIAKGVPVPSGDPGHSCVKIEDRVADALGASCP
jgi:Ca2+-binding EF-hand superfamily protein